MLTVSQLFIYPIKSLGGFSVSDATLTDRGFQYDRRWMLVDENNQFFTQREFGEMALLQVTLTDDGLRVQHKIKGDVIDIPAMPGTNETATVKIWDDTCEAQFVSATADEWFSEMLATKCRLVYMPDSTKRRVEEGYAKNNEITSLSDGYPLLIIGQSSLDELNRRLLEPLPINRFRPNIVFTGGTAFQEDDMKHFTINGIHFYGVKLCARCPITTIDQESAERSKEPLRTLATFRMKNNQVYFGQNLLYDNEGVLRVGDEISIWQDTEEMRYV